MGNPNQIGFPCLTFNILPEEFTSLIQKVIIDQITIRMILNSYSIQSL